MSVSRLCHAAFCSVAALQCFVCMLRTQWLGCMEQPKAMALGRGGARRQQVPRVDCTVVLHAMELYVDSMGSKKALDFGAYTSISRAQAVNGNGLGHNLQLLQVFVKLSVEQVQHVFLKGILASLLLKWPALNPYGWTSTLWSGYTAERIGTMLCHLRRVCREPARWKQMCSKTTPENIEKIKKLKAMLDTQEDKLSSSPEASVEEAPPEDPGHAEGEGPEPAAAEEHLSPQPEAPAAPRLKKRKPCLSPSQLETLGLLEEAAQAAEEAFMPSAKAKAVQANASAEGPAGAKPTRTGKAKAKAKEPKAMAVQSPNVVHSQAFGPLFLTLATKQSYIQYVPEGGAQKVLLVGCSSHQCPSHPEFIKELAAWIASKPGTISKERVVAQRNHWLGLLKE